MSSIQDQPRPRKRHRISESCKHCRSKKTRCDGQRPTCSSCRAKNTTCEYNEPNVLLSSDILSKVADLEARVQALEGLPGNFPGRFHVATSTSPPLPCPGNAQSSIVDNPTLRFISSVTQTAPRGEGDIQTQPDNTNDHVTSFDGMNMSQVILPSREVADDFIECYERLVYPMFPVLHMPSFKAKYLHLWESPSNDQSLDVTFAASLNIVFALGCLNSSKTEPSLTLSTAKTFYERARGILPLDSLDRPSIEVVQYLLLTGNYLSFTKYSHRYCNTLAMSIQVAQTIGLHRVDHDTTHQLEREMGRRVWHLCLIMQRLMSSLFGWNSVLIHDNTCPLPQMIDDEYLLEEGEGCQPTATPSLLGALAVSIKIFDVVAEAREVNAASFLRALKMPELIRILQLNEHLTEIEANLPEHLKYKNGQRASSAREKVLHFQAEVVNLRWYTWHSIKSVELIISRILYVRLLLLRTNLLPTARQVLARQEPSTPPSRLERALRKETWHICVQSAVTALDILHTNLQSCSKIISINAMFVTLSATTVLIASSALPGIEGDLADPPSSHTDSITKAFEILDSHEWRAEGVSETRMKLRKFLQTVENANRDREYAQVPHDTLGGQSDDQLMFSEQTGLFDNIDLGGDLWIPQLDGLLYL